MMTLYVGDGTQLEIESGGTWKSPLTVTVGENGNYKTINEAFTAVTEGYPVYRCGGLAIRIKILAGTTINEQIAVQKADFSYVTIIAEDSVVPVNVDGFVAKGMNSHDLRSPNVGAFIAGENAAGLPTIGCKFQVTQNTKDIAVVGYFANRSSKGVVLSGCGFIGFNDGVIANNESSITIREGLARDCKRWGVHARHNGEVSARSADLRNCKGIAAYADRVANLDVREAILSGSAVAITGANASQICANGAEYEGSVGALNGNCLVNSQSGSVVDCNTMRIRNPRAKTVFGVSYGGMIVACLLDGFKNENGSTLFSKKSNALTMHGIIYADSSYA